MGIVCTHQHASLACIATLYMLVLLVKQVNLAKMETFIIGTATIMVLALRGAVDFAILEYIHEKQTQHELKRKARRAKIQNP